MTKSARQMLAEQVARAERLDDSYLLCRLVGHRWDRQEPDRHPQFGRLVVWECARCTTKRDDILQPNDGSLLVRSYRYAEGYQIRRPKGEPRGGRTFSVAALRLALMHRDDLVDAQESA